MNCALCAGYLALKNDVKSQGIRMPTCTGCRPRGKQCAYLKKKCPKLNGEIQFCFECAEFPCHRLRTIDARYRSRYRTSFIENLTFIKEKGMEKFLQSQEKKWRCPNCGEMICCHNGICFKCGLEKLRAKKQKFRWEDNQETPPKTNPLKPPQKTQADDENV
jgi:hypothetical protein